MRRTDRVLRDRDGRVAALHDEARDRWAAGPPPLTAAAWEDRRYRVMALLDDLPDETDVAVVTTLAATVFLEVADLALATRRWSGRGRRLARRLREADDGLAGTAIGSGTMPR